MKKLFFGMAVCLSSHCFALEACPDNPRKRYHECFGVKQDKSGKSKYVGDFVSNQFHGHGSLTWPDGRQYAGEFTKRSAAWARHRNLAEWDKYIGQYHNGDRHGYGIYLWADGRKYVGEFQKNKKHGMGTMTALSGEEHIGEFQNDKFHGEGLHIWPNRSQYKGSTEMGKDMASVS